MKFVRKISTIKSFDKEIPSETTEEQKIHLEDVENLFRETRVDITSGVSSHDVTAVRLALRSIDFTDRNSWTKDLDSDFSIINYRTPPVTSVGVSRRDPQDRYDGEIAYLLALGRALEALGHKLTHRANSLVKHNDDVKISKLEAKSPLARKRFKTWQEKLMSSRKNEERISVVQGKAADAIKEFVK